MKFLFAAVFVFSTLNFVFGQCDSRGITGLKQCYTTMLKSLNVPFSRNVTQIVNHPNMQNLDQPAFCTIFNEKTRCLGNYEKNCVNAAGFSKAFQTNARESLEFLMQEYFSQYFCNNTNFPNSTECRIDGNVLVSRCQDLQSTTSGCQFINATLKCYDDGMTEQCNDPATVKYLSDAIQYVFRKIAPFCGL